MSDVAAALGLSVESESVVRGTVDLDNFSKSADAAGTASDKVGAATKRSSGDVGSMSSSARAAEAALSALAKAEGSAAQRAMEMAQNAQNAAAGLTKTSGTGRMVAQQFSQMTQQVIAGGNAFQAIAIQLPDIVSQLNASGQAASGLAGFLGGPLGIALTSVIALTASYGFEMLKTEDSTKKGERAQRSFVEVLNDSKSSWVEVAKAAKDYADQAAKNRMTTLDQIALEAKASAGRLETAKSERTKLLAELETAKFRQEIASQFGDVEANARAAQEEVKIATAIKTQVDAISKLEKAYREVSISAADAIAAINADPAKRLTAGYDEWRNRARASITDISDLTKRLTDLNKEEAAAQDRLSEGARKKTEDTLKLAKVTGAEIARALGTTATSGIRTAAQNRAVGGAENSYHLTGQAIDIPLTINGRPITKDWIRSQLEPIGVQIKELLGPGDKGHSDHFHIAFGIKRLAPDQVRKASDDAAEAGRKSAEAFQDAWDLIMVRWNIDLAKDVRATLAANLTADQKAMNEGFAEAQRKRTQGAIDQAEAQQLLNDQLRDTIDYIDKIGGMAGGLGDVAAAVLALRTGDYSGVRGPAGALLQTAGEIQWKQPDGEIRKLREVFTDALDKVFGGQGSFTKVLEGAGIGAANGQILFGGNAPAQFGATAGGALGEAAGAALTKGMKGILGSLGGPLGSIVGSIAGGLLGGLLKKDKYGSTTVTNGGIGSSGNNSEGRSGANSLATSLQSTLVNLAKSLDATLGQFAVSIGVTNGKINVNPGTVSGMIGTTKQSDTIDFGEDQAAALKYAIKNAIEDGALAGLSDGWKKFLLANDDIEGQFQKLSNLKSAYDELAQLKDPRKFEEDALEKMFSELRTTAVQAGDDLAQIEELYGRKRAEIAEKFASDALEIDRQARSMDAEIARLQGDDIKAVAIARELEREQIDASLRDRYDLIASLQDQAAATQAAADAARQLTDAQGNLLSLRERLLQAQGDDAGLRNLQRSLEWDKASAADREALTQIYAAEDLARKAAEAAEARAAATQRAEAIADKRNSLQIDLLNALGNSTAALAKQRELELAGMDASLRGLQQQVWVAQDAAAAADKFREFGKTLREFREGLIAGDQAAAESYRTAQVKFMMTSALASTGDQAAIGNLQGVSKSFLDISLAQAATYEQYQRDLSTVLRGLDATIGYTDGQVNMAEAQLNAIAESNGILRSMEARLASLETNTKAENNAIKKDLSSIVTLLEGPDGDGVLETRTVT